LNLVDIDLPFSLVNQPRISTDFTRFRNMAFT
jgi:hypothetical protein